MIRKPKLVTADLTYIALRDLRLSPLNARQSVPQSDVDEMAGSIAATGLLQNLIGIATPDGTGEIIEIVAGGKRLRALQQMASAGFTPAPGQIFDPVPVLLCDSVADAIRASSVENEARKPPHPADCIITYRQMRDQGATVAAIAAANATTERSVARWLSLADLPEAVIDALRAGQINFDHAKALTLAPTPDAATAMLAAIITGSLSTWQIRRDLTTGSTTANSVRAEFVGLAAYLAAGGTVQRDLFEDVAYLIDTALLDQLVEIRATEMIADLTGPQGWKWAEFRPNFQTWETIRGASQIPRQRAALPEGDQARLDALRDIDGDNITDDEIAERHALIARQHGDWPDDIRATCGVIISLNCQPKYTSCGWQRTADAPATSVQTTGPDGTITTTRLPAADAPSASLAEDLACIRLLSLQNAALAHPTLLLSALAFQISQPHYAYDAALAISTNPVPIKPEKADGTTISPRLQPGTQPHQPTDPAAFVAFTNLTVQDQMETLGRALARLIRPGSAIEYLLAGTVQPDVRAVWHPTAAGYLSRLSVAALDAICTTLIPADFSDTHTAFATMKKRDKAAWLDRLFNDLSLREDIGLSRDQNAAIDAWLPAELRWQRPVGQTEDQITDETSERQVAE